MLYSLDDTIAAIATAPGGAHRGIVRLSGPDAPAALRSVFQPCSGNSLGDAQLPQACSGSLSLGEPLGEVPCDLYLWPTVGSYTRQPVAELHLIGSPPVLEAALGAFCAAGARPAEPGEFTMRAFLAGRIDLTQAEAVLGVIDATGRRELDAALGQLAGGIARPLGQVRDSLLELLAHLEAGLDFVEDDIEFISREQLNRQLRDAYDRVARIAEQMTARGRSGSEVRIVLIGRPNVGKSSLLNALAGDKVAIVSKTPGTTRDYVTRRVEIDGLDCLLVDTAGTAPEVNPGCDVGVGAAAQQVAQEQREQAELLLFCLEATRPLDDWERKELASAADAGRLLVLTKTDLPRRTDLDRLAVATSAKTGAGLDALRRRIVEAVTASTSHQRPVVEGTAMRCRESLHVAADCLRRARETADAGAGEELVAAEVRTALDALGRVVGAVYTDDVLDRIFSRFCIGK